MKNALRDFLLSFNCRNCLDYRDCLTVYRSLLCFNLSVLASVPSMGISDLIHSQIQPVAPVFLSFDTMEGSVILENALLRVEIVRGGLVRSLIHKASGRYGSHLLCLI